MACFDKRMEADMAAYSYLGSSPCEDCDDLNVRHCGAGAVEKCQKNGGCKEYKEYKEQYKKFINSYFLKH